MLRKVMLFLAIVCFGLSRPAIMRARYGVPVRNR